ncbi:hypothetical protein OIO90_004193 [Microbotryomycetes sp. JL221]|nr:hypothetical protein OIO90_004193 [Microbotryomycetes sp. JL221]
MVKNEQTIFNAVPDGEPKVGQTLKKVTTEFDLESVPQDGLTAKTVVLSLDPYMRGRMRSPEGKSYVDAFELGKPLVNFGVSKVLKSNNSNFKAGDHIYNPVHQFAQYQAFSSDVLKMTMKVDDKLGLPWSTWVGAAGMPGQTAWWGVKHIIQPKKGECVFVSGAAGAVGQMVISLCHEAGAEVIASAGTDEKVEYLKKELKVEHAFNYKTTDTAEYLKERPFHAFWDSVGGSVFEAVLAHIEPCGRIAECGQISQYSLKEGYGIRNTFQIVAKRLKLQGFIILHDMSAEDRKAFYAEVPASIANGKLTQPKEHEYKGLDDGESFVGLLTGDNFGKAYISLD